MPPVKLPAMGNASNRSDTADWDRAIGKNSFDACLAVHTEDLADGPPISSGHALRQSPPPPGTHTVRRCLSVIERLGDTDLVLHVALQDLEAYRQPAVTQVR